MLCGCRQAGGAGAADSAEFIADGLGLDDEDKVRTIHHALRLIRLTYKTGMKIVSLA